MSVLSLVLFILLLCQLQKRQSPFLDRLAFSMLLCGSIRCVKTNKLFFGLSTYQVRLIVVATLLHTPILNLGELSLHDK